MSTLAVYIDFSKCFDTLNRNILIKKLRKYGIRGIPLLLLISYLSNRYQAVKVNGTVSNFQLINTGVPQGSVLGPILYLIYVNDVPNISNLFSQCLFADDTDLIFQSSCKDDLLYKTNVGLNQFYSWCCVNRLSINISKTKIMLFSNVLSPADVSEVYMNGLKLEYASSVRFLGLIIDDQLKFDKHAEHISQKISKNIGVLYKLKLYVPKNTLLSIYRCFIECYMNYCILIYGNAYHTHIDCIEIAQRKSLRIIDNQAPFAHSNPIFHDLKMLKFSDIYRYNLGIYMYKNITKFASYFRENQNSTRSGDYYAPTFQRLTLTQNQSIKYQVPQNWNNIPSLVKNSPSISSFKRNYRTYILSFYS